MRAGTVMRLVVLGVLAVAALLSGGVYASPGLTTRVSVDSAGNEGNGNSWTPSISADGRYVAFQSDASNLVPGDTNGYSDVFVHDRETGQTTRVSVDSAGNQANGSSNIPAMSADGRYVAFYSSASNLVPGDTNGYSDAFVHDRQTGETTRVSVDSAGSQGNASSWFAAMSPDGRYVAFQSEASNLVPGDTNDHYDVFLHDRQTQETTRISVDSAGNQGDGDSQFGAMSADGRYLAFWSQAHNLVPGDTNGSSDVFVRDRQTGETTRVSVDSTASQGNARSDFPTISDDGRYVAFYSQASNLVPADTNSEDDVFVHDRQTGETTRVSVDSAGNQGNGRSRWSSISGNGRYIAFNSSASNLVWGDTNEVHDLFVHDLQSGETTRVSVDSAGNEGNGATGGLDYRGIAISSDGRYVAFQSYATNLAPGDTNNRGDIFVHDREPPEPTPTATPTPKPPPGVGGAVKLPPSIVAAQSAAPAEGSSWTVGGVALAGAAVGGALVLAAGGWYARRRFRHRRI